MLYVYGVTRSGREQPAAAGLGSPPEQVRLLESGPIAAAVSELPDDYVLQDEDARAHLQVLIGLLADGPVLPIRMGTVAPGEAAVRNEVLDAAQAELAGRLDSIDGLVELHVDADDEERASIAAVAELAGPRPGPGSDLASRIQFGEEIAGLLVDYRRRLAEEIVDELRPLARRDTPRSALNSAEDPMLRWAFLVAQDDLPRFDAAVAAIRTEHPELAIRYAGPLPPSHFVDGRPSTEEQETTTDRFQSQGAWGWDA
jgi:hypothetical protein